MNVKETREVKDTTTRKNIRLIHELSKVGFSGYGVKKVNQDIFFVFRNLNNNPNHIFLSVWYIKYLTILAMVMEY